MTDRVETLIIGGGIIGHSISYYLNKSGVSTVVVEKSSSGSKATRAAAGMLGVHTENKQASVFHKLCETSRNLYKELSKELRNLTSIDIGLSEYGMIEISVDSEHERELAAKKEEFPDLDWITAEEMNHRYPYIKKTGGALFMKEDGHVEPANTCEAFKRAALFYGGRLIENNTVLGIEKVNEGYQVQLETGTLIAETVVVSSGADSGRWFEATGLENPIVPTKGECFSLFPARQYFKETLFFRNFYLVPKLDGRYVIGATSIPRDRSTTTTGGGLARLMNDVFAVLPGLADEPFQACWSGIRPGSVDDLPIIGEHPNLSGLYFATGHYRNGILLAPVTGQMIRDFIVENEVPYPEKEMLSPGRLATHERRVTL
ncbi:glycine oxidase ThiO [Halobacillus mangrovi]|uniref:glycine oxidase n=1 Tax=Halobacillus mangrovi TaxID=402384 RepID=A0A1W5ZZD2_9BACI|nr:glycine oxidase ThiO [Halobacillus mangrovi]ARI78725.1 glycine oxidase ThiO [Halobacillus mangrovi]